MSVIRFKLIYKYSFLVRSDISDSLEDYMKQIGYISKFDQKYLYKFYDFYKVESKIFMNDEFISNKKRKLCDIIVEDKIPVYPNVLCKDLLYKINEEIWITYSKKISYEELSKPIINYLEHHHIKRACWTISGVPVNVKKNYFDPMSEMIGHMVHHKDCEITKCDIVTYNSGYDGMYLYIDSRCHFVEIIVIVSDPRDEVTPRDKLNFCINIDIPEICDKNRIINECVDNIYMLPQEYNHLRFIDFDLYYVMKHKKFDRKTNKEIINEQVTKIIDNDEFVTKFFCKNNDNIIDITYDMEFKYVIVCKNILSTEFQKLLEIPRILSDIIYTYIDFESVEPIVSEILPIYEE